MKSTPAVTGKSTMTRESAMPASEPTAIKATIGIPSPYKTTSTIARGITTTVSPTEPTIIKTTAVEITGIPSFKERPVVSIVIVIPVVTVPGRIVVIGITGEIIFISYRVGIVSISIRILAHWRRRRIYRPNGNGKTNMRIHIYLRVALESNQAGPYDSRKCK